MTTYSQILPNISLIILVFPPLFICIDAATVITLLDFSTHIQLLLPFTFLTSSIHSSHCHQKKSAKIIIYLHKNK